MKKIIEETVFAVEGLAVCLGQSVNFIEGTAIKDLREIVTTSNQYRKDVDSIKDMLLTINEKAGVVEILLLDVCNYVLYSIYYE